jgi:hypothetical protein
VLKALRDNPLTSRVSNDPEGAGPQEGPVAAAPVRGRRNILL